MKVTNYELSLALKKLGFKASSHVGYMWDGDGPQLLVHNGQMEPDEIDEKDILAFDLETIFSALRETKWFRCTIGKKEANFGYCEIYRDKKNELQENSFSISNLNGESLVDTAAKFLILLHAKGLVKFGEVGK